MNCEYCGAPPMFKAGDEVELNHAWVIASGGTSYSEGTRAQVLSLSRTPYCVRILIDGYRTPHTFHQSFLTLRRNK